MMKYAPKEPSNQAELERFSLTIYSGQPFGCEIEMKFEIYQNRTTHFFLKKFIIQIPCKFSEL